MKGLGYKVRGDRFITEDRTPEEMNPEGFYEVPGMTRFGITEKLLEGMKRRGYDGDVIKLTTMGLLRSEPHLINKVVLCIRDPREVIVSQRGQTNPATDKRNWDRYIIDQCCLFEQVTNWEMFCVVDFSDLLANPSKEIERLCAFLNKLPLPAAVSSVKKNLYRSRKRKIKANKTATLYYEALRQLI
jgi:hypothetical protein